MSPVEIQIEVVEEWAHGNSLRARIIGHWTPALHPDPPEYDHHEISVWHSQEVGWVQADPKKRLGQVVWDFVNDSRTEDEWHELYRIAAEERWPVHPKTSVFVASEADYQ